jgi:hypothetical protein
MLSFEESKAEDPPALGRPKTAARRSSGRERPTPTGWHRRRTAVRRSLRSCADRRYPGVGSGHAVYLGGGVAERGGPRPRPRPRPRRPCASRLLWSHTTAAAVGRRRCDPHPAAQGLSGGRLDQAAWGSSAALGAAGPVALPLAQGQEARGSVPGAPPCGPAIRHRRLDWSV